MRPKSSIPIQLDARFVRYALLTGATIFAGKAAKADVVYMLGPKADFSQGSHSLDLLNDGVTAYFFNGFGTASPGIDVSGANDVPLPTLHTGTDDFVLVYQPELNNSAVPLAVGDVIGYPNINVVAFDQQAAMSGFTATGPLFLGLGFADTNGFDYFGFAEFENFVYQGFAYDNTPDTPITTFDLNAIPEPGSLGMLALGAAGLELVRRKRANQS